MRKLMKQYGIPRVMITDQLRSYGAAKPDLAPGLKHRRHKGALLGHCECSARQWNNRAEVSHKPTRHREQAPDGLLCNPLPVNVRAVSNHHDAPSSFSQPMARSTYFINVFFRHRRRQLSARSWGHARSDAFAIWHTTTCEIAARQFSHLGSALSGKIQTGAHNLTIPAKQIGQLQTDRLILRVERPAVHRGIRQIFIIQLKARG